MNDLTTNVAAFCAVLRAEHHFSIGQAEAHDALRAVETLGVRSESRVRSALRLVCCASYHDTVVFDRAFDRFFREPPRGLAQPAYQPRDTRPDHAKAAPSRPQSAAPPPKARTAEAPDDGDFSGAPNRSELSEDQPDDAATWQTLRARYSPLAAGVDGIRLKTEPARDMLAAAKGVIASVRLGRSRRWKAVETGGRFDLRRTIRASLQTGGEPVEVKLLGHPLRNPRFVILVDGSRSMSDQTAAVLEFARAMCRLTPHAAVFFFSTALREVTRELRERDEASSALGDLGHAWGGGTKIGTNLAAFVAEHGARLLTRDTLVIIYSDGLDVGEIARLERALRDIDRRSAGIVWLNPHAALPGYVPSARGMRAALPYLTLLTAANDARAFGELGAQLARNPRIRGRRR